MENEIRNDLLNNYAVWLAKTMVRFNRKQMGDVQELDLYEVFAGLKLGKKIIKKVKELPTSKIITDGFKKITLEILEQMYEEEEKCKAE